MKNKPIKARSRKIFMLNQEDHSDKFERLFAVTNPHYLALSEANALLLDEAVDKKGNVSLEQMIDLVKQSNDLAIAGTLIQEVNKQSDTVSAALSKLYDTILNFWKPDLNFIQKEQFLNFVNNILLNLDEEKAFPWIRWIKKDKKETIFQYNLYLASDPPEGSFFLYNVPISLTITIDAPYEEVLQLKTSDEITWAWKAEGLKLAQVVSMESALNTTKDQYAGQPPSGIIVSAHGGRWSNVGRGLEVPKDTTIDYFVDDGQILNNEEGTEVLESLIAGSWPKARIVQSIEGGEETYNYECWFARNWGDECGIFEVGTGRMLMPLNRYTEENPLPLSTIVELFPGQTIFWDACRSVTDVEVFTTHPTYVGGYLTAVRKKLTGALSDVD